MYIERKKGTAQQFLKHVDKPSHSLSGLRSGAHECQIRFTPLLALPRLQRFSITLKRRQTLACAPVLVLFTSSS